MAQRPAHAVFAISGSSRRRTPTAQCPHHAALRQPCQHPADQQLRLHRPHRKLTPRLQGSSQGATLQVANDAPGSTVHLSRRQRVRSPCCNRSCGLGMLQLADSFACQLLGPYCTQLLSTQLIKLNDTILKRIPDPAGTCQTTSATANATGLQHLDDPTRAVLCDYTRRR